MPVDSAGPGDVKKNNHSVEELNSVSRRNKVTGRRKKRISHGELFTYLVLAVVLIGIGFGFYLGYRQLQVIHQKFEKLNDSLELLHENLQRETLHINEQISDIHKNIKDIEYTVDNLEEERRRLIEDNQSLRDQNTILENERSNLEGENAHLRSLLSRRYLTYQSAVNRQGKYMPVNSVSGFSAAQIDRAWANLGAYNLVGTGRSFIEAENSTGVNALVLAAIAAHESAFGRSRIARDKNNLFGFGAFDHDPYNQAYTFSSYHDGTITVASYLSRNYLSTGGRFYCGNTLQGINTHYATDIYWADRVSHMMQVIARASVDGATVETWKQYL